MVEDTIPKLLVAKYGEYGGSKVAMRRKKYGIWNEYTWKDYYEYVKYFCIGLLSLGLRTGGKVAILGDNDPEWYWSAIGTQAARGACVGVYPDCNPKEVEYIINHSDSVFVVAEDQEQVDKILEIRDQVPKVRRVIYWDAKGMYSYKDPFIMDFYDVIKLGKDYEKMRPGLFESDIEQGGPEDICVILYTSGTTGMPKGIIMTQAMLVEHGTSWCRRDPWRPTDYYVSYLSPAWSAEWALGVSTGIRTGTTICFPETADTVQVDVREIAPQVILYSARMWESLSSMTQSKIIDSLGVFKFLFNLLLPIGYRVTNTRFHGGKVSLFWRVLYRLADWMLFRPLKDKLGLVRVRWAYTAGAGISPDILRFFHAIGVNLKQMYGLSEATTTTSHLDEDVNPETCGTPLPGQEIRISETGEVLIKPIVELKGYYKDPEATKKLFDDRGWVRTGDAIYITEQGHLVYVDRLASIVHLGEGRIFAPDFVETRLRFSQYIKDVMCVGVEGRDFIIALVVIDYENVGKWAEEHRLAYTTFADLSQKPEVSALILKDMRRVNEVLPDLARIERFVLLSKEFDPDEAELTRTRKLRRAFVKDKFGNLIDAIYAGAEEVAMEIPIVYRDGRKGATRANVHIRRVDS